MIDSKELRCESCNALLGKNLEGKVEIVCHRSRCHRYNVFESNGYNSHKLLNLTEQQSSGRLID